MKTALLPLVLLLPLLPATRAHAAEPVLQAGLESPYVLNSGDGTAYLGILIRPLDPVATAERPPVALSVVIDTSGSMAGEKIEHARFAAARITESLRPTDRISVFEFDDQVRTVTPLVNATDAERARVIAAVERLQPGSTTALYAGLVAGMTSLEGIRDATRRVVLLSDGMANVGPTTAEAIIAGLPRSKGPLTLSTIGIGTDYDEKIMVAVANHGGGGFHHLTDPVQLAGILERELQRARAVAGTAATLEIEPAPGVELLGAVGLDLEPVDCGPGCRRTRIRVGDLYQGETRTVTVQVRVPTQGPEQATLGNVHLSYVSDAGAGQHSPIQRQARVNYVLTPSLAQVESGQIPVYMVAADRMRVAHALIDAAALLKEGDLLEAQALLRDERARLTTRLDRLNGPARSEAEALIEMFRDPYVDADLSGAAPAATVTAARFAQLIDLVRQGQPPPDADLGALDAGRLRILRNAAYARHGYRFKDADLPKHYQPWYRPDPTFTPARLTPADVDTIARIKAHENRTTLQPAGARRTKKPVPFEPLLEAARHGRPLKDADLQALDLRQLRLLRNTTYARHGYAFRAGDLKSHFAKQPWYRPDPAYTPNRLDATDTANVQRIKAREKALLGSGAEALRDFELRNRAKAHEAAR